MIDEGKFIDRIMSLYVDEELLSLSREMVEGKLKEEKGDTRNENAAGKSVNRRNIEVNCNI